jgi:hypothetical protein
MSVNVNYSTVWSKLKTSGEMKSVHVKKELSLVITDHLIVAIVPSLKLVIKSLI